MGIQVDKLVKYFDKNPGAVLILVFIGLLIIAMISLSLSLDKLANRLALYGYYSLTLGIIVQILKVLREDLSRRRKRD